MNTAFPSSMVSGWQPLLSEFDGLPDPNDRHVAAAAAMGRADVLLTQNTKDFPSDVLGHFGLFAQQTDDFMLDLWDLKPGTKKIIFTTMCEIADDRQIDWRDVAKELTRADMRAVIKEIYSWHFDQS